MRRSRAGGISTALALLLTAGLSVQAADIRQGKATVHQVIDGDTVMVTSDKGRAVVVRLLGIDAPEDHGTETFRGRWAAAARNTLIDLVQDKEVRIAYAAESPRDRFGRLLGYLILPDGTNVNEVMISRGMALHFRKYQHPLFDRFDALQAEARAALRGFHAPDEPARPPEAAAPASPAAPAARPAPRPVAARPPARPAKEEKLPPFFVTVTGKIHRGTCDLKFVVQDRKDGKIELFDSFQDAQEGRNKRGRARWKGTSSCKHCRPYL